MALQVSSLLVSLEEAEGQEVLHQRMKRFWKKWLNRLAESLRRLAGKTADALLAVIIIIINEYFNRIILQSYLTYTHIYTVISEVLYKNYKKLKSRSIINNILKSKILKLKTLRSQKVNSQKRKSQRLIKGH